MEPLCWLLKIEVDMKWIQTLVHRPALVTVIYLIITMFGLFSYSKLPVDMLPDLEAPVLTWL